MRTICRMFWVWTVVMAVATSCSVTKVVRDSRVVDLDCNVMQMPTVAELEVDENPVEADTTWRKTMFDGTTFSKKQYTSNLIASILEKNNADVLIEPKVSHESKGNVFSTSHKLTVSGYPARYVKFRTASLEDVMVINELTKTPVATDIVIANGVGISKTGLSKGEEKAVKIAKNKVRKTYPSAWRKKGYRGDINLGGGYNISDETGFFSVSTTHGYQFNPYIFLGAGVNYLYTDLLTGKGYGYDTYDVHCLQVYPDVKVYMSKANFAPFVDVKLGFSTATDNGTSVFLGAGLGFGIKGFELAFNYNYLGSIDCHTIGLSVGWAF